METHFRGPIGEYRCVIHNTDAMPRGWLVERIETDGKTHLIGMHMTREEAFLQARELSGLHAPDVVVVEPEEPLPDRRGLVEHSRRLA